jgi:hypothetical protein
MAASMVRVGPQLAKMLKQLAEMNAESPEQTVARLIRSAYRDQLLQMKTRAGLFPGLSSRGKATPKQRTQKPANAAGRTSKAAKNRAPAKQPTKARAAAKKPAATAASTAARRQPPPSPVRRRRAGT